MVGRNAAHMRTISISISMWSFSFTPDDASISHVNEIKSIGQRESTKMTVSTIKIFSQVLKCLFALKICSC